MNKIKEINKLSDSNFKELVGVKKETFNQMVAILKEVYAQKLKKKGRHSKLSIEEQLLLCLKYNRRYITQKLLAFEFGVVEATAHYVIVWVEDTLIKSGEFNLPEKKRY